MRLVDHLRLTAQGRGRQMAEEKAEHQGEVVQGFRRSGDREFRNREEIES